jgi:tetratricopeptide (TPR) repeat protein
LREVCNKIQAHSNTFCRKSQIAIEYCYRYRKDHPEAHIFWIHASNLARFTEAFHQIGKELGLSDVDNPEVDTLQLVQKWLSNDANGPWLLVVDNADDIETFFGSRDNESAEQDGRQARALFKYLPQSSNGSMILTTRDKRIGQRLAKLEKPIDVLPFEMRDAKHLLQKTLHDNDLNNDHSVALLEALDFLPMAIIQAAAFIRENDISVLEYLGYVRASDKEAKDLLAEIYHDPGRDPESHNSVFQTSRISFDCIRRQKPRAAEILSLMAVLDRQAIQKCLLRKDDERDIEFATAIGTLKAFSLITEERVEGTFGMHRLMQLSTQRWLELEGVIEVWQKKAMDVVSRFCTDDYVFIGDWKSWGSISPHAQVVLSFVFQSEPFLLERAVILHRLAIHELEQGYIVNADARVHEALATIQKLDEDHPKKLAIASTAAGVLSFQGKFEASEKMDRFVLEHRKRIMGPSHPDTLVTLADLAATLGNQGKHDEAEALLRQATEVWRKSPDLQTHRFRFSSLWVLAANLELQGKYEDAEENIKEAIEGYTKVLGAKHPLTTWHLVRLSGILLKQEKFEAAEAVARGGLQDFECSLGPQHMSSLICLGSLADILESREKFEEAETLRRRALAGFESLLGPEHQNTILALARLAYPLAMRDKYQEAESASRQVLRACEDRSGSEYPTIFFAISASALILQMQEKWEEAERVRRRAFHGFENLLGPEHVETLRALMALAYVLDKQDKYQEAESALRQALRVCEDKFGPGYRNTLIALSALALLLGRQEKWVECEAVSLQAFHGYEIAFGPNHRHTVLGLAYVAFAMVRQRKFEAVEAMCCPLLGGYQEVLGFEHSALTSLYDSVAEALTNLGKYEEAEPLSRQASKGYEEALGIEHHATLASLTILAFILEKQKSYEAAEAVRRRVLEIQEKVRGPDHSDTAMTVYALAWIHHKRMEYDQASVLYQRSWAVLQKTPGPDHEVTVACLEGLAALKAISQYQGHLSPRYFPRLRRLIRSLTRLKKGQERYTSNLSRQVSNS